MLLEISFETKSLRGICENVEEAVESYNENIALKLRTRLADFIAAANVNEIYAGSPSEIIYNSKPCYKVDLIDYHRIIFCSSHPRHLLLREGEMDWNNVNRIKILAIDKENE